MRRTFLLVLTLLALGAPAAAETIHAGMNIPDLCTPNATKTAAGSGNWSAGGTWGGSAPGAGAIVEIPAGVTVTLDTSTASLSGLCIHGTLSISRSATTAITATQIIVYSTGTLDQGTVASPLPHGFTHTVTFRDVALDTVNDPEQWLNGMIVAGTWTATGYTVSPTFSRVTTEPLAGGTSITVTDALSNWFTGDEIILPDTRTLALSERYAEVGGGSYASQTEVRTLSSVSSSTLGFTGWTYNHLGGYGYDKTDPTRTTRQLEYLPHVGNITRNVVFRSENPAGTRGHILATGMASVNLHYIRLEDLGRTKALEVLDCTVRTTGASPVGDPACVAGTGAVTHVGTNQIGRYPLHFHKTQGPAVGTLTEGGTNYQFVVVGLSIVRSLKWPVAIHGAHYGLLRDTVIYDWTGSGVATEDGTETEDLIDHNFVVKGTGTGGRQGMGREGIAYWFRGTNIRVTNNVAANIVSYTLDSAYGYKFFPFYLGDVNIPNAQGTDQSNPSNYTVTPGSEIPVLEFNNNETYGGTESGITFWWIGSQEMQPTVNMAPSYFDNSTVWNVYNRGVFVYPGNNIWFRNFTFRGSATSDTFIGIYTSDYMIANLHVENADIQGAMWGMGGTPFQNNTTTYVTNSYFENQANVVWQQIFTVNSTTDGMETRRGLDISNSDLSHYHIYNNSELQRGQIYMQYGIPSGFQTTNIISDDTVNVHNLVGLAGDYRVFTIFADPAQVLPQTIFNGDGSTLVHGSPVSGETNQQNWDNRGIAWAGAVATCTDTVSGFEGAYVCAGSSSPPPDPPAYGRGRGLRAFFGRMFGRGGGE